MTVTAMAAMESVNMGTIHREEFDGKVSLFIQPLSGGELLSMMRIRADISPPTRDDAQGLLPRGNA